MAKKEPKTETEDEAAPSGGGIMSVIPLAVIAAAATFGMVWFAAAPPPPPMMPDCSMVEMEPPEPPTPEELEARVANYVILEPITVTLGPDAGANHLRMTVVLGTPPDMEELSEVQFLRLRDRFLERLRIADSSLITDPEAMPALKEVLLSQARSTLGDDAVYNILITDFLMN